MEKSNACLAWLDDLKTTLQSDNLTRLDFDQLAARLDDIIAALNESDRLGSEYELLHADYLSRITGMLKAIAAVDRTGDRQPAIMSTIESLVTMTAAELLECHRRTSARFRDTFPTSFGFLGNGSGVGKKLRDYDDYK